MKSGRGREHDCCDEKYPLLWITLISFKKCNNRHVKYFISDHTFEKKKINPSQKYARLSDISVNYLIIWTRDSINPFNKFLKYPSTLLSSHLGLFVRVLVEEENSRSILSECWQIDVVGPEKTYYTMTIISKLLVTLGNFYSRRNWLM